MSNKTNEEIKNLEKQLELLKQKQQIEDENKKLKEDVAYLRKSQQERDKHEERGAVFTCGCLILFILIPIIFLILFW